MQHCAWFSSLSLFCPHFRRCWTNARTSGPATSWSIAVFLDLTFVQEAVNTSWSPLNANLVSNFRGRGGSMFGLWALPPPFPCTPWETISASGHGSNFEILSNRNVGAPPYPHLALLGGPPGVTSGNTGEANVVPGIELCPWHVLDLCCVTQIIPLTPVSNLLFVCRCMYYHVLLTVYSTCIYFN